MMIVRTIMKRKDLFSKTCYTFWKDRHWKRDVFFGNLLVLSRQFLLMKNLISDHTLHMYTPGDIVVVDQIETIFYQLIVYLLLSLPGGTSLHKTEKGCREVSQHQNHHIPHQHHHHQFCYPHHWHHHRCCHHDLKWHSSSLIDIVIFMITFIDYCCRWDGWLVEFLNGQRNQEMRDIPSGLLTVPLLVMMMMMMMMTMMMIVNGLLCLESRVWLLIKYFLLSPTTPTSYHLFSYVTHHFMPPSWFVTHHKIDFHLNLYHRNLFITKTFNSAEFFSRHKTREITKISLFLWREKISRVESLGDEKISMHSFPFYWHDPHYQEVFSAKTADCPHHHDQHQDIDHHHDNYHDDDNPDHDDMVDNKTLFHHHHHHVQHHHHNHNQNPNNYDHDNDNKVDNTLFNISYPATLVAGQIGFSLHEESVIILIIMMMKTLLMMMKNMMITNDDSCTDPATLVTRSASLFMRNWWS